MLQSYRGLWFGIYYFFTLILPIFTNFLLDLRHHLNMRVFKEGVSVMGFVLAGVLSVVVLIYLIYAMFNPERF